MVKLLEHILQIYTIGSLNDTLFVKINHKITNMGSHKIFSGYKF